MRLLFKTFLLQSSFRSCLDSLGWAEKKILKKGGLKSWETAQKQILK